MEVIIIVECSRKINRVAFASLEISFCNPFRVINSVSFADHMRRQVNAFDSADSGIICVRSVLVFRVCLTQNTRDILSRFFIQVFNVAFRTVFHSWKILKHNFDFLIICFCFSSLARVKRVRIVRSFLFFKYSKHTIRNSFANTLRTWTLSNVSSTQSRIVRKLFSASIRVTIVPNTFEKYSTQVRRSFAASRYASLFEFWCERDITKLAKECAIFCSFPIFSQCFVKGLAILKYLWFAQNTRPLRPP